MDPYDFLDLVANNKFESALKALAVDSSLTSFKDEDTGESLLFTIAGRGNVEVCKALIEAGAEIDAKSLNGETPLDRAASSGSVELVGFLLNSGADVSSADRPLVYAVNSSEGDPVGVLECLLEHGADVNECHAMFGDETNLKTVLDFVGGKENLKTFLLSKGAKSAVDD